MTIYEIEQEVINFHNKYENNAKKYGYETRKDTKELDLDSPNGRTMIATVFEILHPYTEKIEKLEEENDKLIARYNNLKEEHKDTITRNEDYRERIDKAIAYIKCGKTFDDIETARIIDKYEKILLEILQGSDKK